MDELSGLRERVAVLELIAADLAARGMDADAATMHNVACSWDNCMCWKRGVRAARDRWKEYRADHPAKGDEMVAAAPGARLSVDEANAVERILRAEIERGSQTDDFESAEQERDYRAAREALFRAYDKLKTSALAPHPALPPSEKERG